jgi:hypothetical protein
MNSELEEMGEGDRRGATEREREPERVAANMDLIRGQLPGPTGVPGAPRDAAARACDLGKRRPPPWGRQSLARISDGATASFNLVMPLVFLAR